MEKIAIIVPMYNEEMTIKSVIEELDEVLEGGSIYVFDNNSSDKSYAIVESLIKHKELGEHSSLGIQCGRFSKFQGFTDNKSNLTPKNPLKTLKATLQILECYCLEWNL